MSRGRLIKSPNAVVFVQDGQAFSESDLDVNLYKLTQNFGYSISLSREQPKQIGSQELSFRELNRQPDVQLNFSYIPEPSLENETQGKFFPSSYGPELVTNTKLTDSSEWSPQSTVGAVSFSDEGATFTITAGGYAKLKQNITYEVGKTYIATVNAVGVAGKQLRVQDDDGGVGGLGTTNLFTFDGTNQTLTFPFVANSNSDSILLSRESNGTYSTLVKTISVREYKSGDKNMFSGTLDEDTNFYIVNSPETGNIDAFDSVTFDNSLFNLTGFDCMAFGNCFPVSYGLNYAVGAMPTVSTSYICSNMVFEHLTGTSMESPAINLTGGNNDNVGRSLFQILPQTTDDRRPPIINPTDPQSSVTLENLQVGGQNLSGIHFIQSVDMQINLNRVSSYGLGNDFAYNRKAQLPAQGNFSVSSLVSGFDEGFVTGVLKNDESYNFELILASGNKKIIYTIEEAKLDSYSYGMPINDRMTFDANFNFTVTENKGLRISGTYY